MAITLTDDMRAAVHAEDCERLGHDFAFDAAFQSDPHTSRPSLDSRDAGKMPHLSCRRCGSVWLIIEDAGSSYADAESRLARRLKDPRAVRLGKEA